MKKLIVFLFAACIISCKSSQKSTSDSVEFPVELVHFVPYKNNPVFAGTGSTTWDNQIRERGYIIHEDDMYYLYYTGYTNIDSIKFLGLAISPDGFTWTRYKDNPIHATSWVEDVNVIKSHGTYYMFSEGKGDTAHMLTSTDRIHWTEQGNLDIRTTKGVSISKGPYGTPTVLEANGMWYLFYERDDTGIWVATSKDLKVWTNVQDDPVIKMGPEPYDQYAVAMDQVIKYKGLYYGYYHATAFKDWHEWSTDVAVSKDLIHWKKYPGNPIVGNDKSSGILVKVGNRYLLYTMHPDVNIYFPITDTTSK